METILDEVVKLVFSVAALVIAPLAVALVARLLRKVGLSLDAEKQAKIEKIARDGILLAEEKAARLVKAKLRPMLSSEKLAMAMKHLLDQVPGISTDEAELIVTQELPKVGVGATAVFAATRQAVTQE